MAIKAKLGNELLKLVLQTGLVVRKQKPGRKPAKVEKAEKPVKAAKATKPAAQPEDYDTE